MEDGAGERTNRIFSRSFFPFFLSAFFIGMAASAIIGLGEVVGLVLLVIGVAMGMYSVSYWMGYETEIRVVRRRR